MSSPKTPEQEQIRADLRALVKSQGHGSVTFISGQLRLSRQYLHEFLSGRDIGFRKLSSILAFLGLKGIPGYESFSSESFAEDDPRPELLPGRGVSPDTMCLQCDRLTPAPPRGKYCCHCGLRLAIQCGNRSCRLWNILNQGAREGHTLSCQRCGGPLGSGGVGDGAQ